MPSTLSTKPGSSGGFGSAEPPVANGSGGLAPATTISGSSSGRDAAVARAVEEEVDAAILSRQVARPDKWSRVVLGADGGSDGSGGLSTATATGKEGGGAGGAPSREAGAGGGAGIPPRPSTGGGAPATAPAAAASASGKDKKGRRRSSAGMGSKKSSTVAETVEQATAVEDGGPGVPVLSKKEKKAMLVAEVRLGGWVVGWVVERLVNRSK